jgi:signal transduction histidine kinase/ActR/RegA family two-component response regulator
VRITTIVTIALMIAALGGVTVATVLDRGYYRLRLLDEGLGQNSLAEARMETFRHDVEQLLVSADLYVASEIQYLATGVERQISRLGEIARGLNDYEVIRREAPLLRNVLSDLAAVDSAVAAVGAARDASVDLVGTYDQAAEALATSVVGLSESVGIHLATDRSEAVIAAEDHKWFQLLLLISYLFLMLSVLAVTLRWIANPVRRLTIHAQDAMEMGLPFQPVTRGPEELRQLGTTISKFVSGLERRVAARTSELREQADELRKEVNARRQTEAELLLAKRAAEAASEAKSEFLSVMSHELRTPMNAVIGTLTLLQDTKLGKEQHLYVRTARESGLALMSLLNDVLDLSTIEAGRLGLESVQFCPADTMEGVLELFYPTCMSRGLVLAGRVSPDVPHRLQGDPRRVRQVLANLVGNAVKFTKSGHIYISVESCLDLHGRQQIRFSVSDTGCGISEEDLSVVFAKFSQLDKSHTRRQSGSGLGLAISRRLVQLMGGEIGVSSEVGKGSEFFFTLPACTSSGSAVDGPSADAVTAMPGNVVIAGPPSELARAVREVLSGWVGEISSIEEPQHLAEHGGSASQAPTLILVLGQDDPTWRDWYATAGHHASRYGACFAVAPRLSERAHSIVPTDLFHGIYSKVLSSRGVLEMLGGAHSALEDSRHSIAPLTRSGRILLVEDTAASRLVAKNILENVGYTVDLAEDGLEAAEIFQQNQAYDLVLMDLQMPKMDGYEANRVIRTVCEDLPIVALSADVMAAQQARTRAVHFDGYLEKPLDRDTLLSCVERCIRHAAENRSPLRVPA